MRVIAVDCERTVAVAVFSPRAAARALCGRRGTGRDRVRVIHAKGRRATQDRRGQEKIEGVVRREHTCFGAGICPAAAAACLQWRSSRRHGNARRMIVGRGVIAETRASAQSAARSDRRASSCIHGRRALMREERGTSRAGLMVLADVPSAPRAPPSSLSPFPIRPLPRPTRRTRRARPR